MFSDHRRWLVSFLVVALAALACNMPSGAPATDETPVTDTPSPTPTAESELPTPTFTAVAEEVCTPTVTATTLANVRSGPGQNYPILGNLPQGATATAAGKSQDSQWWYIQFAGGENGYAWISTTVTSAACIPDTLAIIAAPPAPAVQASPTEVAGNDQPNDPATPTSILLIVPPGGFKLVPTPTPTLIFLKPIFPILPGP